MNSKQTTGKCQGCGAVTLLYPGGKCYNCTKKQHLETMEYEHKTFGQMCTCTMCKGKPWGRVW